MRHHDAARGGRLGVDMIVADAETRDDLQLRELRDIGVVDARRVMRDDERADARRDLGERGGGVGRLHGRCSVARAATRSAMTGMPGAGIRTS